MSNEPRSPQAFILPQADLAKPTKTKKRHVASKLVFEPELEHTDLVTLPRTATLPAPRRFNWLGLLLTCILGLILMWAGLATTQLIESFFARNAFLGWTAFAIATLAGGAAVAIILREIFGLLQLNKIEALQEKAARAINLDEQSSATAACLELQAMYKGRADVAWGLQQFASHKQDILDPKDRMALADSLVLRPLDEMAHKIIAKRARRVTLLTTVTSAAALDILFVAAQNLAMLRELATLYGGRPSTLTTLKLARMVVTHLAITGGLALSDNLIQYFIGKGLLGRLSARFGEGAVNGILTARIGLAATDVCRPIPRAAATRDTLTSLLKEVLSFGEKPPSDDDDGSTKTLR
jgi:putative membrane protein